LTEFFSKFISKKSIKNWYKQIKEGKFNKRRNKTSKKLIEDWIKEKIKKVINKKRRKNNWNTKIVKLKI